METNSVQCSVNEDSVWPPRKKPSTSKNITLPVMSVGKLIRRRALFVAMSQRVCDFEIALQETFETSLAVNKRI